MVFDGKETEWNAAMLQSIRLDKEFQITNEIFSTYHIEYHPAILKTLQSHIFNIFDEVKPKMSQKEKEIAKKYIIKINEIKKISAMRRTKEDGSIMAIDFKRYDNKVHRLRAFRQFVIAVADKAGMLNPNKKRMGMGWQ